MKKAMTTAAIIIIILCACVHSDIIAEGCSKGIQLWYSSVVPVIMPFMLIVSLVITSVDSMHISGVFAYGLVIVIGLLCGFPTGTMIISAFCGNGIIPRNHCQLLLPVCNNVSAMFLCGYIFNQFLCNYISMTDTLVFLYLPQLIYTAAAFACSCAYHHFAPQCRRNKMLLDETSATAIQNTSSALLLENTVRNISVIGVYMAVFSIVIRIIQDTFTSVTSDVLASFMEISQGIGILNSMNINEHTKIALILSLTSFGGLSAIFQSYSLIKESKLSFTEYIIGKCACAVICYVSAILFIK